MDESSDIEYKNLGESILVNTLSTAYLTVAKTPIYTNSKTQREAMESIIFIFDGSVDIIIQDFALGYNPNKLRVLFFDFLKDSYREIRNDMPTGYSNQKLDTIISFIETSKILD